MECSLYASCLECIGCGFWFLLFENSSNACFESPDVGFYVERYIGTALGCQASMDPFPTVTNSPVTEESFSLENHPTFSSAATIALLILGIGFTIAVGIAIFCWIKRRSTFQQLHVTKERLHGQYTEETQQRELNVMAASTRYQRLNEFCPGASGGQIGDPLISRTSNSDEGSRSNSTQARGGVQIMKVCEPGGIVRIVETRF